MSSQNEHGVLVCRGIRGATTAMANTAEDILEATDEMMRALIALNDLTPDDVVSAIFTTTHDLTATFPALGGSRNRLARGSVDVQSRDECARSIDEVRSRSAPRQYDQ